MSTPLSFAPARKYWHPPFKHDSGMIVDKDFHRILDVRGWGHLTGKGSHGIDENAAAEIQDAIGEWVAVMLTDYWHAKDVPAPTPDPRDAALLAAVEALKCLLVPYLESKVNGLPSGVYIQRFRFEQAEQALSLLSAHTEGMKEKKHHG